MRISDWSSDVCSSDLLLIRYKLAGVPTLPVRRVLYRYLAHEGSTTLNAERRHEIKMCRERIAIAGSFISGERLSSSLLSRFRGWIAAERARIMMAALKSRDRSEEHTSELQSLMRISYAVFCLQKKKPPCTNTRRIHTHKQ